MEFGQVLLAFRRRLGAIFAADPANMAAMEKLASEPCTDTLVAPSVISKQVQ